MGNGFLGEIFSKLDMVVLERLSQNAGFEVLGQKIPDWFKFDKSVSSSVAQVTHLVQRSDFLKDFLESEAVPFWKDHQSGELTSGPWSEEHLTHGGIRLEATALAIGQKKYLMIKKVGQEVAAREAWLQKKRENALRAEQLRNQDSDNAVHPEGLASQTAMIEDDISVMLDKLRIGASVLDREERIVFINPPAKRMLGFMNDDPVGRVLWEVCAFRDEDRATIQRYMKNSVQARPIIPVKILKNNRPFCSFKVDVQDYPRDPLKRLLFLYRFRKLDKKSPARLKVESIPRKQEKEH